MTPEQITALEAELVAMQKAGANAVELQAVELAIANAKEALNPSEPVVIPKGPLDV